MPVSMKRGFLLNGSGQPLARWKGEKWLSARQLLLSTGFCQVRSHSFFFFFSSSPPRPVSFFSSWVSGCVVRPAEKRTEKRSALLMEEAMPCGPAWVLILSKELEGGARPPSSASSTLHPPPITCEISGLALQDVLERTSQHVWLW